MVGPRVYVPQWDNDVACFDFSAGTSCSGYPKYFNNLDLLYTVNADPQRPTCIWVNSDNGSDQIQNFDAFGGSGCGEGPIRVLASQFIVPSPACAPASYQSLQINDPAASTYDTSGAPNGSNITFEDADGNPIAGVPTQYLDSTGTVSLVGLNLSGPLGLPQFLISLVNPTTPITSVTVTLTWTATYNPACNPSGGGPTPTPVTTTTSLSGGGSTGASITVAPSTAVTDTATLSGTDTPAAGGTVTYSVYSDANCTQLVAGSSSTVDVTDGAVPASSPVSLSSSGTYYWQASYSGDPGNEASTSSCGSEVETVTGSTGSDADLVVTMSAPSTNQAGSGFPVSVTVTNDGPATSNNIVVGLLVPKDLDILNQSNAKKIGRLLGWFHTPLAAGDSVTYTVWLCSTTTDSGKTLIPAAALSLSTPDPNYLNNIAADVVTFTPAAGTMKVGLAHASYRSLVLLAALRADGRELKAQGSSTKQALRVKHQRPNARVRKAHSGSTRRS